MLGTAATMCGSAAILVQLAASAAYRLASGTAADSVAAAVFHNFIILCAEQCTCGWL